MIKKNKLFLFLLLTYSLSLLSQNANTTKVIYKISKPTVEKKLETPTNSDIRAFLDKRDEAYDLVECELIYTNKKSLFKIIDKLEFENNQAYGLVAIFASGVYYKDLNENYKSKLLEIQGELFNISLPFDEFKWEISTESKIINGYKCYKAVSTYKEYNFRKKSYIIFNPEVWFTPEIPAPFGPRGLDGLPGLVLEGKYNNHAYFYASNIIFGLDVSVEEPKKGKKIMLQDFQEILRKIYEQREELIKN
ncbi:MAG: GLPGLI family protein [Flavobacterium sp.]|jgi:GLPGLI family protein|uniref:GLPGLI family protein n=1 Tax=Flavobacterium sp. TaxID=239 RepID=UPI002C29E559|nr:GLPGLI family protein [Flavobacterium sp.]HQA73505.1 GLPGLI family protein [Flavobacterium sp.]